ncbi:MAG TPA: MFS transporter [Candidatus Faecimorpha stercoravium]|nr:MFS transporter [Candidatus Faecimorpha stercoravium]
MSTKRVKWIFGLATMFFWASEYCHVPFFTPYLRTLGLSATLIGFLVGCYGFTQLCVRIPLGIFADMSGRYRFLVRAGCFFTTISSLGLYMTQDVFWMFVCRILAGVAASTWVAFTVMFTGYFPEEESGKAIAQINGFNNTGKLLAFFLGSASATAFGYQAPLLMSCITGFAAMFFSFFIKDNDSRRTPQKPRELLEVFKDVSVLVPAVLAIVLQMLMQGTAFSFTSDVARSIGANAVEIGVSSCLFTATQIGAVFFLNSSWAGKQDRKNMVAAGFLLYTLYCLMVGFAPNMILMYAAQIIGGFANAVLTSVLMASCIAYVAPEKKSTAMGLYQAIYGIGMTIGPVIMGSFVDWSGYGGAFSLFALCALAAAIGALIFMPMVKRIKTRS